MTNHPNRSTTTEALIRRMTERMGVRRVEIATRNGKSFTATAYPMNWHKIVEERRVAKFGTGNLTIAQATRLLNEAHEEALASATGITVKDAVDGLFQGVSEIAIT